MTAEREIETARGDRLSVAAIPGHWRLPLVLLALALGAVLLLLHETVFSMVAIWSRSGTFGHGFIVAPMSLYLVWLRRHELAELTPRPSGIGVLLILGCGFIWLLADATSVAVIEQLAAVAMLQATVLALLGLRVAWRLALPLCFLLFMVPAGDALLPGMQTLTALMIVHVLNWVDVPVFLDGYYLTTSTGSFHVAEACAGLRYLVSSVVVGTLFAGLMYQSWWRRAAFIVISFLVPVVANGIRASMIVLLAHFSDGAIATGVDHLIYGWVFLSVVTLLLLAAGMALREKSAPAPRESRAVLRSAGSPASPMALILATAAIVAAIAAGPAARLWVQRAPAPAAIRLAAPSPNDASWQAMPAQSFAWRPEAVGADAEAAAAFMRDRRRVFVDIAYYTHDRPGAEAVSSANALAPKPWTQTNGGKAIVTLDGEMLAVTATYLRNSGRDLVVWQWYWVDGSFVGNPYVAKARQAVAALLGRDRAAALVTVAAEYQTYDPPPVAALRDFVRDLGPLAPILRQAARPAP
jgi:exosortase A